MSYFRSVTKTLLALAAVGSLVMLAACAPEPEPTPTGTTAAPETSAPDTYDGPLVFVGDELAWFLPTAEEISAVVPGATEITAPSSSLIQIADGGGPEAEPSICAAPFAEASLGSIGARTVTWPTPVADQQSGRLQVLQFADATHAQNRMDDYVAASEQCAEFSYGGPSSFDAVSVVDPEGARAVAGSLILTDTNGGEIMRMYYGFASIGNVIVEFWQPFTGDSTLDAEAAATLLRDRANAARTTLVDALTANPPTPQADAPAADPNAPWSEWQIGFAGVGPIPLGVEIDAAVATAPGAEVIEPDWEGGPWEVVSGDGSGSLAVASAEDGTLVATITAGDFALYGESPADGSTLPTANGVGVGDRVADAIAAFPGGTSVQVVAAGMHLYEVSTREGRALLFYADRDLTDAESKIIGVSAEDATLRRQFDFD